MFEILVEEILSHELKPDEPLVERTLADRFGLSRTPIREILRRLESEYLVAFYPNQGAFVRRLTPKNVRDLFQLRQALEPMAASLAAENRPDDEMAEFMTVLLPAREAQRATAEELTRFGQSFHDAVARWADNELLFDIYMILRRQTRLVRTITRTSHEVEVQSYHEHRAIFGAIEARDAGKAHGLMLDHLRRTNAVVLELITS